MIFSPPYQLLWLALLCAPPVLIALAFALRARKPPNGGDIRIGNPMFKPHALPPIQDAVLSPLLHLTRTQSDADLRSLILGLRHMPLTDTAYILRRYQHSADPELQIYSQSILQQKQEQLQSAFAQLLPRANPESPAILASCIEAALHLASSPLTPESERIAVLRKSAPKAEAVSASGTTHPRAVFAAAKFCLLIRLVSRAEELCARLPVASPLWDALSASVRHQAAILHPPPPLTSGYSIH